MPPPGTDPKTGHFEGGGRVIFGFLDDINYFRLKGLPLLKGLRFDMLSSVPWYAELTLQVKDVAVLLKSGLFWTEANIDPTNNFFDDRKVASHLGSEWLNPIDSYGRFYELRDTEPAQWHGTLMVRAHSLSTLRQFRPSQLSLANVRYVTAKNPHGQTVYHFNSDDSDRCFNAILEDTPLKGWWPWPKKEDTDDDSTQGAMDDDVTQKDLNAKLKHEDTDDNLTQEDLDAKLKQEDTDDDSMLKDTVDDSMLEDTDDSDRDDDSMLKYTADESMLEDTDDDSSDQ
ncbi:hypothetical protein CRV24_009470 [Beauveria bassiana]|nr:hypothetical protein CRV24_009470 [Beauveria bassiana]